MIPNQDTIRKALSIVGTQRAKLDALSDNLATNIPVWKDRTMRMLSDVLVKAELDLFASISTSSWPGDREAFLRFLYDIEEGIRDLPEHYIQADPLPAEPKTATESPTRPKSGPPSNNVFIVHGHDSLAKLELARSLQRLGLNPIVLHEQANEGKTIIEKFERDASKVSFAVVLLTPDDIGYPKDKPDQAEPRARQNVILELGFFSGALGRGNVCVLYKGNVEIPSDYVGVVYVNMDDAGAWRFALAKELKQAGLPVDLNSLV